jgi:hypothetical protein
MPLQLFLMVDKGIPVLLLASTAELNLPRMASVLASYQITALALLVYSLSDSP